MKPAIRLENVTKKFDELTALQSVGLSVEKGEFIAVVGSSGCGKSTLLRLIAGLLPATEGSVMVNGHHIDGPTEDVGIAFQTPVLLPWRTVRENIALPLEIQGARRASYEDAIGRMIDLVGLKGFEDKQPHQLSGGMQQRVSLCRALIHDPALLLMDEPFGALDAMTREQMNLEVQRIWMETGKTVVLITHSIIEAVFLADRVVVMSSRPGRVVDVLDVKVPRPRSFSNLGDPGFQEASDRIRELMNANGMVE
ncbi:ABC transporter ATP-binding protein [Pelagibacterium montanilacus]|uniref:ABC transporter ATP-binding protein n=1 Tax=Pelagibacterium montanilacus TaxID=2185280 RepID=UPI000F8F0E34|nr:ABC transporter ATP-binding protein [Pelagibacterium montanilacus]